MIFDPLYLLLMAPAFIFSLITSFWVKSAFRKYSKVATASGLTGAQAAARVMRSANVNDVQIEATRGFLSDHYDPSKKVLRLSPDVYQGRSIASIGVAAHEAGHAIQDAAGYAPMKLRSAIVPMASIGSNLSWILLIGGAILGMAGLIKVGAVLFSAVVAFQIVTLPVEINASRRALAAISSSGILIAQEQVGARKVLTAAAMTYVAAAASAILTLLYFLIRAGLLGGRD
ncbi:MAG: zinc metallopeptidase [Deltaproteobacteria bacterium]|nr:zinc metallopeptidase [Candidatus Zymogenaceae bacterium]